MELLKVFRIEPGFPLVGRFGVCARGRWRRIASVSLVTFLGGTALAGTVENPESSASGGIVLGAPEVIRTDWNVGALAGGDLDGDGRGDFGIVNPDRLRVELYFRREAGDPQLVGEEGREDDVVTGWVPSFTNAPFERVVLRLGRVPGDLAVADLDADGYTDLIVAVGGDSLEIHRGSADGFERDRIERIDDVPVSRDRHRILVRTGEGRIGYLGDNRFLVWEDRGEGIWELTCTHRLVGDSALGGELKDFDGDGRLDLAYADRKTPGFLHWIPDVFTAGGVGQMLYLGPVRNGFLGLENGGDVPAITTIGAEDAVVSRGDLREGPGPGRFATVRTIPAGTAVGFEHGPSAGWVAASPEAAEILWLRGGEDGNEVVETFPSFRGIVAMESVEAFEGEGLPGGVLLYSDAEGFVGFSGFVDGEGFTFPEVFEVEDTPVGFAWDAGRRRVAVAVREGRIEYAIRFFRQTGEGWIVEGDRLELEGLKRPPEWMQFARLDDGSGACLLILVAGEPLVVLRETVDADSSEWIRMVAGIFPGEGDGGLEGSRLGVGDLDGDRVEELYVTSKGFVRQYRLNGDAGLGIAGQFNASDPGMDLFSPVIEGPEEAARIGQIHALSAGGERWVVFGPDPTGDGVVFKGTRKVLPAAAGRLLAGASPEDRGVAFGFLGKHGLMLSARGPGVRHYDGVPIFVNGNPEVFYAGAWAGDLGSDGQSEIVLLSPGTARLEVLSPEAGGGSGGVWRSRLWFRVFEENPHAMGGGRNRIEPREAAILDATGDGRGDLVVVVHDRILIYPWK